MEVVDAVSGQAPGGGGRLHEPGELRLFTEHINDGPLRMDSSQPRQGPGVESLRWCADRPTDDNQRRIPERAASEMLQQLLSDARLSETLPSSVLRQTKVSTRVPSRSIYL
jgi:hypothetical protein